MGKCGPTSNWAHLEFATRLLWAFGALQTANSVPLYYEHLNIAWALAVFTIIVFGDPAMLCLSLCLSLVKCFLTPAAAFCGILGLLSNSAVGCRSSTRGQSCRCRAASIKQMWACADIVQVARHSPSSFWKRCSVDVADKVNKKTQTKHNKQKNKRHKPINQHKTIKAMLIRSGLKCLLLCTVAVHSSLNTCGLRTPSWRQADKRRSACNLSECIFPWRLKTSLSVLSLVSVALPQRLLLSLVFSQPLSLRDFLRPWIEFGLCWNCNMMITSQLSRFMSLSRD